MRDAAVVSIVGIGWFVVALLLVDIREKLRKIDNRLAALERAGILIQPDGKHDQHLVMSRREKLRLAERFARTRAQGA